MPPTTEATVISWEKAPAYAANSHKTTDKGTPIDVPEQLTDTTGERVDLRKQGGAFFIGQSTTLITVRHPMWRGKDGDPIVYTSDVMVVHGHNTADSSLNRPSRIATEAEGFAIDGANSEPVKAATQDDEHPELFVDCLEEATPPARNMFEAAEHLLQAYQRLWARAKESGGLFYPGSNLAHRARKILDINPHNYVRRIVRNVGRRNPHNLPPDEAMIWLDGASVQNHFEREFGHEAGTFALNTHSAVLSPLTMGLTAASPFARGDYLPTFIGPYANRKSKVGYMATRFMGRMIGSPEAGPLRAFIPADKTQLAITIGERMRDGQINNPGRVGNQHGDVRARTDLAPQGTHELCAKDTDGGHVESLMAIAAFERSFMHVLEKAHKDGRIEQLAKRYPLIVNSNLYSEEKSLLVNALGNSEAISVHGLDAQVIGADGQPVSAREMLCQAVNMVKLETQRRESEEYRLHQRAFDWIGTRMGSPNYRAIQTQDIRGGKSEPLVTLRRFYRGERGTLSHYLRIRVSQLVLTDGLATSAAIAQAQVEAAQCHEEYLNRVHPQRDFAFLRAAA